MKTRILVSMLLIILSAAMIGGATAAIFTASANTDAESYVAGTIKIDAGEIVNVESGNLDNLAPGDTVQGSFEIINDGTLELWFNIEAITNGSLFEGDTPAQIVIEPPQGSLSPKEETTVTFTVTLPFEANNTYQGAEGELQFAVYAQQKDNNNNPSWETKEID